MTRKEKESKPRHSSPVARHFLGLPHRPPFVFVKKLIAREPGISAEAPAVRDLDAVERDAISTAIGRRHGNLTMVAKDLRISKSTLYLKIDKHGLNPTLRQARQHDR